MSILLAFQGAPPAEPDLILLAPYSFDEDIDDADVAIELGRFLVEDIVLDAPGVFVLDEEGDWNEGWPSGDQFIEPPVVDFGTFIPTFRPRRGR